MIVLLIEKRKAVDSLTNCMVSCAPIQYFLSRGSNFVSDVELNWD